MLCERSRTFPKSSGMSRTYPNGFLQSYRSGTHSEMTLAGRPHFLTPWRDSFGFRAFPACCRISLQNSTYKALGLQPRKLNLQTPKKSQTHIRLAELTLEARKRFCGHGPAAPAPQVPGPGGRGSCRRVPAHRHLLSHQGCRVIPGMNVFICVVWVTVTRQV